MNTPDDSSASLTRERLLSGCETMKKLLMGLLDSKGRIAEEVHALRKLGKSLRGGCTLFGLEKSSALEIQAIGRLLSGPRDAISRLNTWNKLAWNDDPEVAAAITGLLDQQTHSAARRPPHETIEWCVRRVTMTQEGLLGLPEDTLPEMIVRGLGKLEKRALKPCRRLRHRDMEDFHEARKAVKAWLGALDFLPDDAPPLIRRFQKLADELGDENDLATLSDWLEDHGFIRRFAPDLWKAIKRARRRLQDAVAKDAAKLAEALAA